ncbi:hypothetical protein BKA70DRAFT_1435741 [Coprinopsis sp. MPI-PUGE-AT-0042]|nr:hypothetical protein BKA70DRAFT_1435741 [Coprinopsis sp. MPI-PUGE-AT-0042]
MTQRITLISHIVEGCFTLDPEHLGSTIMACTEASDLMDVTGNGTLDGHRDDLYLLYLFGVDFDRCPILNLMAIFLSQERGKETLLRQWFIRINEQGKHRRKLDPSVHLANTILSRLTQVEDAVDQRTCNIRVAASNLTTMEAIFNALTQVIKDRSVETTIERGVYIALDKRRYLYLYMRCLRTISAYSLKKERSTGFLIRPADEAALPVVCLGRALGELFRTLCRTSHFLLTHLVEWVDGGLIQVVANCAVLLRHYPDPARELFPPDFDP